jgi:hypothetical protein
MPPKIADEDQLAALAKQQLSLHTKLAAAKPGHARTVLERQIAATDQQIDQLVYQLYGLTEDEVALVEAAAK